MPVLPRFDLTIPRKVRRHCRVRGRDAGTNVIGSTELYTLFLQTSVNSWTTAKSISPTPAARIFMILSPLSLLQ